MDTLFLKRVSLKKGAHLDRLSYLYRIPTLRGFRSLVFSSPVTFFTGGKRRRESPPAGGGRRRARL